MDQQSFEIEGLDFIVSMPVIFITLFIRQHNSITINILVRVCFILLQFILPELFNVQILCLVPINSLLFKIKDGKSDQHECVWIRRASFPI